MCVMYACVRSCDTVVLCMFLSLSLALSLARALSLYRARALISLLLSLSLSRCVKYLCVFVVKAGRFAVSNYSLSGNSIHGIITYMGNYYLQGTLRRQTATVYQATPSVQGHTQACFLAWTALSLTR
jgi:hypothetical protein